MESFEELRRPCDGPRLSRLRAWHCGELVGVAAQDVERHVGGCPACQAVVAEFRKEQAAFEQLLPLGDLQRTARRRRSSGGNLRRLAVASGVLATAAAVTLTFRDTEVAQAPQPAIRTKGGSVATLQVHVRTPDGSRPGLAGEAFAPGTQLRIGYAPVSEPFVLVASVDADGRVTPLLDEAGRSAPTIRHGSLLPDAVELDDDPRPEVFVAVFSEAPLSFETLRPALERLAAGARESPGDVPGRLETLLIRKVSGVPSKQ